MPDMKVPGIIGGAWVQDVSKALVSIPGWAQAFNEGVRINQGGGNSFTMSPWANRCISIRMNALSKLPWEIQQNGMPVPDTELEDIFDESKIVNLLRHTEADLLLTGRGFWQRGFVGRHLVQLRRLNSGTMTMKKTPDGIEWFEQNLQGKVTRFKPEEIVYFHEFDPNDDLDGIALAKVAEMAIMAEYNADRYITAFFKNYAVPPVVFTTEADLPPSEATKAEVWWKRLFGGVQNQFKAGFLGRGMKPNVIGFSPDKLALAEVRVEARRSICGTFGVPPTVANATDPGSYATADEERQSFYEETMIPRAEWFAEQINEQIVQHYRTDMEFKFKTDDLPTLQEDETRRAERLASLVSAGIITEQTAGAELGYSPEEIGKGRQETPAFGGLGGLGLGGFGQPPVPPQAPKPGGFTAAAGGRVVSSSAGKAEADEESGSLLGDLKLWRRKAFKRAKRGQAAAAEFVSSSIAPALSSAILGQLEGAKSPEEVHAIFDRVERDIATRRIPREDDMQVHVHNHFDNMKLEIPTPVVNVNVEPAPVEFVPPAVVNVEAKSNVPDINIENKVDVSPIAKAMKAKDTGPKMTGRSEETILDRDREGKPAGSRSRVTYEYEE